MTGHRTIARRFDARERERLGKLFRQLGTDNTHEAEAARSRINALLQQFGKGWLDLTSLLSGGTVTIGPDLASDIAGLGAADPDQRANARRNLVDLLERHRKNWNDLADALCAITSASWLGSSAADPPRVNPLALVVHLLEEYVALAGPHEYVAVALWILHTHIYRRFTVSPRLALRSPVAGCGKSVLLDIVARLAAHPAKYDSITASAIFHLIDEAHPTLLIDEADNLELGLRANGRIRAIFNSGHRNGGQMAIRDRGETRNFSTFAPLALALPDALPRTLNSRCITLVMQRSDGRRQLRRLDVNRPDPAINAAYAQILLWRSDVELDAEPEMPTGMHNRLADNWRPLLSIADSLNWGEQAREAMVAFAHAFQDADVRISLLTDIRKVFDMKAIDRLPSKALLDALLALDESDWREFRGIRGDQQPHKMKDTEVATMLREFRIRPRTIWPPGRTSKSRSAKGYRRSQFEEIWRAYCADDGTTAQPNTFRGLRAVDGDT